MPKSPMTPEMQEHVDTLGDAITAILNPDGQPPHGWVLAFVATGTIDPDIITCSNLNDEGMMRICAQLAIDISTSMTPEDAAMADVGIVAPTIQ